MSPAKIVKVDPDFPEEKYLQEAADILAAGGLVIIPTETVYGIATNISDKKAAERLYAIKGRPGDKPFSLHIDNKDSVEGIAKDIPVTAYKLMDKFWPGPLTLVLKSKTDKTIGMRMPDDKIALRVIGLAEIPIVCPSANLSGRPAPKNFTEAIKDMQDLVDLAIDAGPTKLGIESSVVDLSNADIRFLREGALKKEDILAVANKKIVLFICTGNSCRSVMAKGLLEKRLKEKKRADVEVLSAGLMLTGGMPASFETQELLKGEGIDVSAHRSQRVTAAMIKKADLILVMEKLQEERILQTAPEAKNRVFLLKEFAKIKDNNLDIADPIGRPKDFYEQIFGMIKDSIERAGEII